MAGEPHVEESTAPELMEDIGGAGGVEEETVGLNEEIRQTGMEEPEEAVDDAVVSVTAAAAVETMAGDAIVATESNAGADLGEEAEPDHHVVGDGTAVT
eukprot:SAG11_NODE_3043_length_2737_cov_9.484458_2_plen_99_part_00